MIPRIIGGCLFAVTLVCAVAVRAQDVGLTTAKALYREHCSKCHGLIAPDARGQVDWQTPVRPGSLVARTTVATSPPDRGTRTVLLHPSRLSDWRVAFAPPYGPPLRGIYGRPAGSVASFSYSRAFKQALSGVVWDSDTLDLWLTNTQKRAPGSLMFYRQADSGIRRHIIAYLKAHSPATTR
ncbi:hypothetical protein NKDENANG_01165 [Candidatus Entotheonellaceae bacterium PAL068K]